MKKPRIDESEKEELMKHLFHMGYIKSVPGKWVLTMKGQQIFSIFTELKKKGHVEDIDIALWRGAYTIDSLVLIKENAENEKGNLGRSSNP